MKLFSKIALVSAMAISANAMALESMDDEALSAATGQDGITLTVMTDGISIDKLLIHDNDGLDSTVTTQGGANLGGTGAAGDYTTGAAGAIVVNGVTVGVSGATGQAELATVTIDTDAGVDGENPFLNINMKNNAIDIGVDSIAVGASNDVPAEGARRGVDAATETEIISGLDITVGASELNIQLGAQPQGAMIVANGTIQDGITIHSLNLIDTRGTVIDTTDDGTIAISDLRITSAGSTDLAVDTAISVLPDTHASGGGLSISTAGEAKDIYIDSIAFGNANSIGSIEIQGLDMGNTQLIVSGH